MKSLKLTSRDRNVAFPVDGRLRSVGFMPLNEDPTIAQEIQYELSLLIAAKVIVQTHAMGWHKGGFVIVLKRAWPFRANETLRIWVHPHPMYRDLLESKEPPTPPLYEAELRYE